MRPESRWACLLLVCGVVAAGCAYYNTFYNARTSYEQARKLARENPEHPSAPEAELLTSAIYGAGKVISVYPESRWVDDAQLLIGDASLLLGQRSTTGSGTSNFQDAMLAYSSVLVITDDQEMRDRAGLGIGRAAMELGRYMDAAAALETVSADDEDRFYISRILLADALLQESRTDRALALLDTLEEPSDDSLSAELELARGRVLLAEGQPDSAAVLCLRAGDIFGRGAGYYNALVAAAQAYIEAGRPESAAEVLDKLLMGYRSNREMAWIALLNGRAKQSGGDAQGAIASYGSAAQLDPTGETGTEALYRRALLEESLGRLGEALEDLAAASSGSAENLWSRLAADRLLDLQLLDEYLRDLQVAGGEDAWHRKLLVAEKRIDLYGVDDSEADSLLRRIALLGDTVPRARALVLVSARAASPAEEESLLVEALELCRESDLATRIEERLGLPHPGAAFQRRPTQVLERGWEMIGEAGYAEAWELLSEALESPWSGERRPELLWAAAVAAEFSRQSDSVVEALLSELAGDFADTAEGLWATSRLGTPGSGEDGGDGGS